MLNKLNFLKLCKSIKWTRKKILAIVMVLIIIGGGFWYVRGRKSQTTTPQIQTEQVTQQNLEKTIVLSGQVEQSNVISVLTKASGVVQEVFVTDGQYVEEGDTLATIELDSEGKNSQASAWSQYLSAQTAVKSAENQMYSLESKMWAANDNFIHNAVDLDKAETESEYIQTNRDWLAAENSYLNQKDVVAQAKSALNQAWYNYQLYQNEITAPSDGTIVGLNIAPGLTVSYTEGNSGGSASQTVARIQTEGTPVALFNVTEVDITQIEVGMPVSITLDSFPDQEYTGVVAAVDRVGSATSGVTQYPVLVTFSSSDPDVLPNMAATAEIVLEKADNALVVPISALSEGKNGQSMVQVMVDGKPQQVQVETGLETDTQVEIISGLSAGDVVITGTTSGTSSQSSSENADNNFQPGFGAAMGGGMQPPH